MKLEDALALVNSIVARNREANINCGFEPDEFSAAARALAVRCAQAAVLAEREACAKLCELHAVESQVIIAMTIDMSQHEVASLSCAAAIRARGE